jgi:hypothetical protein
VILPAELLEFVRLLTPVGTLFWKRVKAVMMVIPPLGTVAIQAVYWRIPNLVILLPLAKLVLPLVPVGFVIRLVVLQEFVKLPILVETQFWRLAKVVMMEIPQMVIIVPLPV